MSGRHPFHSICPYFAMFPEQFVREQVLAFSLPGEIVFDPFCGRGTTVFESLLRRRQSAGSDINPVAVCISSAKAMAPQCFEVMRKIENLENRFQRCIEERISPTPFFEKCFERKTLEEILFLREALDWRNDPVDCFIAALILGILHGESHRSENCLSNRMPRTISTKPRYSMRWWEERGLRPPRRRTFDILKNATMFRYRMPLAESCGLIKQVDARFVDVEFVHLAGKVKLVVTSPPYIDTTDYAEDQWLRLWFLGGKPYPETRLFRDDRYIRLNEYWKFLRESWSGLSSLMADDSTIVIRLGGMKLSKSELFVGLSESLVAAFGEHDLFPLNDGVTSSIRPRDVTAFRNESEKPRVEHDFVYRITRRSGFG